MTSLRKQGRHLHGDRCSAGIIGFLPVKEWHGNSRELDKLRDKRLVLQEKTRLQALARAMESMFYPGKLAGTIGLAIAVIGIVLAQSVAQAASITALGDLPGGAFNSRAFALSNDGQVTVGRSASSVSGLLGESFRWTIGSGMEDLEGALPPYESQASGVSENGNIIVGNVDFGPTEHAFRWTEGAGMESLGFLSENFFSSAAFDVSADGSVIVGRSRSGNSGVEGEAFRWTRPTGMVGIGFLSNASESQALGISADGTVIVGWSDPGGVRQAFLWNSVDGMVGLGDFPGGGIASLANAASADGSVVVGWGSSVQGREAFRWTMDGGLVGIGDLPGGGFLSEAFDVSGDGSVIVGQATDDNFFQPFQAFIWDAGNGMRRLSDVLGQLGVDIASAGFVDLISAQAVSSNGQFIAGWGQNAQGNIEAFVVNLGAEPQSCFIDLSLTVQAGTLVMDFGLSTLEPGNFNLFLNAFDQSYTLLESPSPLPVIDPPQYFALTIPSFPDVGRVGILATVTAGQDGIRCSAWETVDTSPGS